ncbi:conjugal transfer protein [Streptomyces chattanoogensis]|uniref:conjugal transfer protein n=1 Tax=Streptomyces chattanoogensis TaxID=66876 RepID=UPI0036B00259
MGLWLQGNGSESGSESAAQKAVRAMAPAVALPEFGERPEAVDQVRAVRSARVRPGAWSVTVAAVRRSGAQGAVVRYFRVPVLFRGGAGRQSFVVASAPAQVPGPAVQKAPASPYSAEVASGSALSSTVSEFLSAYLAGTGGAERYLAPHADVAPLGAAYRSVRTERVSATGSADGSVGADGQRVRVRVQVVARDAQGAQWPLTYALRLAARDGRWEVLALDSGLEDARVSHGGGA